MRIGVAAALAATCLLSCSSGTSVARPSPTAPPGEASNQSLLAYYGSYRTGDGDTLVIARLGWFFDMGDGTYRTIFTTHEATHFTIGRTFKEPLPKFADLVFGQGTLTISEGSRSRVGLRLRYRQTDVKIAAAGAELAGTITEPLGNEPHPGIVIVHGAERGERYFYDVWVGVYTSMGLAVLTYDKRGIGSSTGLYPGEFASIDALKIYADDASAALRFLSHWPGIDRSQVGFHGGSQGGWTVPLAIQRNHQAAFAVLASAPATTVDQTDLWAGFSGGGAEMPSESVDEMLSSVRATHSGYDPIPALRALGVPALWLLGVNDRTVPTTVCVEILSEMHKPNFTVRLLPTGHGLLVNPTGLLADDDRSPGLAPDLVPILRSWMAQARAST